MSSVASLYCPNCPTELSEQALFCPACGQTVAQQAAPKQQAAKTTYPRAPEEPSQYSEDEHWRSHSSSLVSRGKAAVGQGLRERIIDLTGMPRSIRWLAILGYASVTTLLVVVVLVELLGERVPVVEFVLQRTSGDTVRIALPAAVATSVGFAVGWALLLTGASDCRRRVFLPVVGLFIFEVFLLVTHKEFWGSGGILLMWGLILLLVVVPVVVRLFTPRLRYWRDFPLIEFFFWVVIVSVLVFSPWLLGNDESYSAVVHYLEGTLAVLLVLSVVFWPLLGLDVVDLALDVTRPAVLRLHRSLPETKLRVVTLLALLAVPALIFFVAVVGILDSYGSVMFAGSSLPVSILLIVLALVQVVRRRWTAQAGSTLLALSLAWFVLMLGLALAFSGTDFTELALGSPGLIPPAFLFAGLLAYDVLNFGVRFASIEGRLMPRTGRTLMYFGAVILVISMVLLELNRHSVTDPETVRVVDLVNGFIFIGVVLLGVPYFVWIVWKRRERLIGEDADQTRYATADQEGRGI